MFGIYYSGTSSKPEACALHLDGNGNIVIDGLAVGPIPLPEIEISDRLGSASRHIYFKSGGSFETMDHAGCDRLQKQLNAVSNGSANRFRWLIYWENSIGLMFLAILVAIGFVFATVFYGIPTMGNQVANKVSKEHSELLGKKVLEMLDEDYLAATKLSVEQQRETEILFHALASQVLAQKVKLHFRHGNSLKANAFALPGSQFVVTDELVNLAKPDELRSVLLHELGHVKYQHALKGAIDAVGIYVLVGLMVGDLDAMDSLTVLLPTIALQSKYSRDSEMEADDFVLSAKVDPRISPTSFIDILRKLEAGSISGKTEGADSSKENAEKLYQILEYFSSHPLTEDRIAKFEDALKAKVSTE